MDLSNTKFFIPLSLLYFLAVIFPSIYSYDFIKIGFLYMNVGSLFVPLIYMLGDINTELYSYQVFKKTVLSASLISIIFSSTTYLLTKISPGLNPKFSEAYNIIFGHNYRIVLAVLVGLTFSALVNSYILSELRKTFNGKHYIFRSIISSIVGEGFEAITVGLIGYLYILPLSKIFQLAASVMVYRIFANILLSLPALGIIKFVRMKDELEPSHLYI